MIIKRNFKKLFFMSSLSYSSTLHILHKCSRPFSTKQKVSLDLSQEQCPNKKSDLVQRQNFLGSILA